MPMLFSNTELILIAVIVAALFLIITNRLRPDLVALLVLLALALTQVVTPEQALAGFSRSAVITIISLFIISTALENTGVVEWVADHLRVLGRGSEARLIVLFMGTGALLSLVMNNIAAGAVLLPAAVQVARDSDVRTSRLLIPLSFGTLVGGMATYFTTANIVMSSILQDQGLSGLGMSDFIPTGGLITLATLMYMAAIGRKLLPNRESVGKQVSPNALSRSLEDTYRLKERMWEVRIPVSSQLAGVKLCDSHIGEQLGITVLAIWHGNEAILTPEPTQVIQPDDYLLLLGREERVKKLEEWGVQMGRSNGATPSHDYAVDLTEVIIPPRSSVIGKTLKDLRFRNKYGLTNVALWREGRSYRTDVGTFPLQVGDALLMVGPVKSIRALSQERDFLMLQSSHSARPPLPQKAGWALIITFIVLIVAIFEWIPTPEAMLAGAVAMILAGCVTMDEAYTSIEWRVVFLIAGMSPLSTALVNTGLGARAGELIMTTLAPYGSLVIIAGIFVLTMLVTQVMAGQVAALVVGPIAISAALQMGINPQAAAVTAAIACSTAFLLPTAHPVNVLMMGPGGYKPGDFPRVGLGMTIITFIGVLIGMRLFFDVGG
jgi:di/tricarboxylate transporter